MHTVKHTVKHTGETLSNTQEGQEKFYQEANFDFIHRDYMTFKGLNNLEERRSILDQFPNPLALLKSGGDPV